jgi:hypothetical protein
MVKLWLDYRKKLLSEWERDTKLYNNERVFKKYEGIADTFVPMTYSTLETISSALLTGNYNTDFVPQDIYKYLKDRLMPGYTGQMVDEEGNTVAESEEQYLVRAIQNTLKGGAIQDEALDVLNALYDYAWDKGNWDMAVGDMIDDGVQIGTGAVWMTMKNGLPRLESVPFPDYVFDPRATDDDCAKFAGRRYLASLKDLRAEKIVDPKTGKATKRYNLTGLKKRAVNGNDDKTQKELMEQMLLGSTVEVKDDKGVLKEDNDQCEVIELWTEDRMYTLVNRSCIAEDVENPIVTQAKLKKCDPTRMITIPGTTWANIRRGSMLVGRSETSTFWKEQERLNDHTNQKSDAVTRALLQQYRADPALKGQKNSFSVPGAVIWAQQGQYDTVPPAQVPNASFNEEASIKNNIRETTATDQIVKGVAATGDVTATEANLQVAQSDQRIEKKIKQLERGPLTRIARLGLQYIRLFITDPFIIPQHVDGGIKPMLYNPKNYDYDFEPKVTLTVSAQSKQQQERKMAADEYALIAEDPSNNIQAAKEILYPKMFDLDKDEIQRITTPPIASTPNPAGSVTPPMPGAAMPSASDASAPMTTSEPSVMPPTGTPAPMGAMA